MKEGRQKGCWIGGLMHDSGRWINTGANHSEKSFWPLLFLAVFSFQVRIAIYYPNYNLIKTPTKMLTWAALTLSMCLTS